MPARIFHRAKDQFEEAGALHSELPLSRYVNDSVFHCKSGAFGVLVEITGIDPECRLEGDLYNYSRRIEKAFTILDERFRVYQYVIKRFGSPIPHKVDHPNERAQEFVSRRVRDLEQRSETIASVSNHMAILFEPTQIKRYFGLSTKRTIRELTLDDIHSVELLTSTVRAFMSSIDDMLGFELLDESLGKLFFRQLLNLDPIHASEFHEEAGDRLDYVVADTDLYVHHNYLTLDDYYLTAASIKLTPSKPKPARIAAGLNEIQCDFIACIEWKPQSTINMRKLIKAREKTFVAQGISVLQAAFAGAWTPKSEMPRKRDVEYHAENLGDCLEAIEAGSRFGAFSCVVILLGKDYQRVRNAFAELVRVYGQADASLYKESLNLLSAYLSIIPGNNARNHSYSYLLSYDYANLAFAWQSYTGNPVNKHLRNEYLCLYETADQQLFYYNAHVGGTFGVFKTGAPESGKAQPHGSLVLTPDGFRKIEELSVGDSVCCPDGTIAPISGVYPQGEKDIFRLTFQDGRSAESCDEHLWKIFKRDRRKWKVCRLSEIRKFPAWQRPAIPLMDTNANNPTEQELPIPPYALGALLGDGYIGPSRSVLFSTADSFILDRLASELPAYKFIKDKWGSEYNYRLIMKDPISHLKGRSNAIVDKPLNITRRPGPRGFILTHEGVAQTFSQWAAHAGIRSAGLRYRLYRSKWSVAQAIGLVPKRPNPGVARSPLNVALRLLGLQGCLSQHKLVPAAYKRGSFSQRLALLQGLMDTDGGVEKNGSCATFSSVSHTLAEDVRELVWSVGGTADIKPRQTYAYNNGHKKPGQPSWRVTIRHRDLKSLFSLPRKVEQCSKNPRFSRDKLYIQKIEPVGQKSARCIRIDHPDGLYITDKYLVTHNSYDTVYQVANLQKYNPLTLILDIGGSYRDLTDYFHGAYYEISKGEQKTKMNPFSLPNTHENREFLFYFLRLLLGEHKTADPQKLASENKAIYDAIEGVFVLDPEHRRMKHLSLPAHLQSRLNRWCEGGQYGHVFDHATDTVRLQDFQTFEFQGLEKTPEILAPMIFYVTQRFDQLVYDPALISRLKVLIIDEGWRWLLNGEMGPYMVDKLKTGRKHNLCNMFITQSGLDAERAGFGEILNEACPVKVFFANSDIRPETYETFYGLNSLQAERIAQLKPREELAIFATDPGRPAMKQFKVVKLRIDDAEDRLLCSNDPNSNIYKLQRKAVGA